MINLKDVSIRDFDLFDYFGKYATSEDVEVLRKKVQFLDCQQLNDLIDAGDSYFDTVGFKEYLSLIKDIIQQPKYLYKNAQIYNVDNYKNFNVDDDMLKELREVDLNVYGGDLLFCNPLTKSSAINFKLRRFNVAKIKYLLEHCVVTRTCSVGENALANMRGFGSNNISKVVNSIKFYEEQVIRQLKENNGNIDSNLFYKDYDDKIFIILDNLNEIAQYFVENANECVWGKISIPQKEALISKVNKKNPVDDIIVSNFVNAIANYTTISELDKGVVKNKTLNRFIVK